jgi:hypothetical protein
MISREGLTSGVFAEASCSEAAGAKCFRAFGFWLLEVLDEITGWANADGFGWVAVATLAGSTELEDPTIAFGA